MQPEAKHLDCSQGPGPVNLLVISMSGHGSLRFESKATEQTLQSVQHTWCYELVFLLEFLQFES